MTDASEHDLPWYSDPDYDCIGKLIHPLPADYEPEPAPIYCSVCGDMQVENAGDMCEFCASPEQVAERAEFAAWLVKQEKRNEQ